MTDTSTWVIYTSAGQILRAVTCPEALALLQITDGEHLLEGECDDILQYVDVTNLAIIDKPSLPITHVTEASASGIIPVVVSGIPIGATITLGELSAVTTDASDLELLFDIVGTYKLTATLFPYLPYEAEINAT